MTINLTLPTYSDDSLTGCRRILIVDDEPAILFAYLKLMRSEGYIIDAVEELDEALQLIATFSYFAVITDVRLSGSDNIGGITLLQAVREQQPKAKVIVVTGFGDTKIKETIKKLGASYYFEKPVKPSLIIELLQAFSTMVDEQLDDFEFGVTPTGIIRG